MPLGSQDAHSLVFGAIGVMVNLNISAAAAASKDLLQRQSEQRQNKNLWQKLKVSTGEGHSLRITSDKSAVSLLERRKARYRKATNRMLAVQGMSTSSTVFPACKETISFCVHGTPSQESMQ